jgi:hypothetical protein
MLKTNSIYVGKTYDHVQGYTNLIAAYASELRCCEQLAVMGWTHSNGVCIDTRARELEKEIARLEELRKRELRPERR